MVKHLGLFTAARGTYRGVWSNQSYKFHSQQEENCYADFVPDSEWSDQDSGCEFAQCEEAVGEREYGIAKNPQ